MMAILMIGALAGATYGAYVVYRVIANVAASSDAGSATSAEAPDSAEASAAATVATSLEAPATGGASIVASLRAAQSAATTASGGSTKQGESIGQDKDQGESIGYDYNQAEYGPCGDALADKWPLGTAGAYKWALDVAKQMGYDAEETASLRDTVLCGWAAINEDGTAKVWLTAMQHYTNRDYAAFSAAMAGYMYAFDQRMYDALVKDAGGKAGRILRYHPYNWWRTSSVCAERSSDPRNALVFRAHEEVYRGKRGGGC